MRAIVELYEDRKEAYPSVKTLVTLGKEDLSIKVTALSCTNTLVNWIVPRRCGIRGKRRKLTMNVYLYVPHLVFCSLPNLNLSEPHFFRELDKTSALSLSHPIVFPCPLCFRLYTREPYISLGVQSPCTFWSYLACTLMNFLPHTKDRLICSYTFCVLQISDLGGGVPLRKIDRLFNYMYSTAPRPSLEPTRAAPLVSISNYCWRKDL